MVIREEFVMFFKWSFHNHQVGYNKLVH